MRSDFKITPSHLISEEYGSVCHNAFIFLTGKKINLNIRIGTTITIVKDTGYIRIFDEFFIVDEYYKNHLGTYQCKYKYMSHESNKNTALLATTDNSTKIIFCDKTPIELSWEVK